MAWRLGLVALIGSLLCFGAGMTTVQAETGVRDQYATSKQPYWRVGRYNRTLSIACQKGEFLQKEYLRWSIGFNGRQGRGVTGVAFKGWNLIDKFGRAQDGMTYHFHNQGYSNCKVYESQTPRR